MKAWTHMDKAGWGDGPWNTEPDKMQWVDPVTDLDCLIVRNHHGSLCGYVGCPPSHPWHGLDSFDDLWDINVHGGLTFSGACDEDAPEGHGICHVPEPGRPGDVWWLGFDCGHAWDVLPGMDAFWRARGELPLRERHPGLFMGETYKSVPYVVEEVLRLALQVRARYPLALEPAVA